MTQSKRLAETQLLFERLSASVDESLSIGTPRWGQFACEPSGFNALTEIRDRKDLLAGSDVVASFKR